MSIKDTTIRKMNELGAAGIPFIFILDYKAQNNIVLPLDQVRSQDILFDFHGVTNTHLKSSFRPEIHAHPLSYKQYKEKFDLIQNQLFLGNSYLLNLTFATPIDLKGNLQDVFLATKAKYKLYVKGRFTCFSPESFIKIQQNKVYCYPMKGTIDANIPNAKQILLSDKKETKEHYTIVDLIRNDLSIIGKNTKVDRFAYIDTLETSKGPILQMSSQISADLADDWKQNIGTIFSKLLPAGSITGSPKKKTMQIIQQTEDHNRGYYTGVCGIFDGTQLDSGVMIRFIEQNNDLYTYKSGGGITIESQSEKEYQELIQKIYLPL